MKRMPQTRLAGKTPAPKKRRSHADRQREYRAEAPTLAAIRLSRRFGLSVSVAAVVATLAGLGQEGAHHG